MTEENKKEEQEKIWWKKLLLGMLRSPVQSIFGIFTLIYLLRIFLLGQDELTIKAQAVGVIFLWVLWVVAKSIIKLLLFIALLLVGGYGYYYYTHHSEISCEENGGYWNAKEEVCEEKGNLWQQIMRWLKFE